MERACTSANARKRKRRSHQRRTMAPPRQQRLLPLKLRKVVQALPLRSGPWLTSEWARRPWLCPAMTTTTARASNLKRWATMRKRPATTPTPSLREVEAPSEDVVDSEEVADDRGVASVSSYEEAPPPEQEWGSSSRPSISATAPSWRETAEAERSVNVGDNEEVADDHRGAAAVASTE